MMQRSEGSPAASIIKMKLSAWKGEGWEGQDWPSGLENELRQAHGVSWETPGLGGRSEKGFSQWMRKKAPGSERWVRSPW